MAKRESKRPRPGGKSQPRPQEAPAGAAGLVAKAHGRRAAAVAGLVVVAACVLAVHWPALSARALSVDDNQYLLDNPLVRQPGWDSTKRFLTEVLRPSSVKGYYQPLSMISLMLDYAQGGSEDDPRAFHRTSLALHVANTVLIVALLYLLFGNLPVAAMVGLLFGVHPMVVDPIPWVSERKTLLATFFSLLCLIFYARYAKAGSRGGFGLSLVAFVLALMSKPTSTPLPVCMLIMDYWPLRRLSRKSLIEKVPFFVVAAISAGITFYSQKHTAAVVMPEAYGPMRIPLALCYNIFFYPYKMIYPAGISSHYPVPEPLSLSDPMVLTGVLATCALLVGLAVSLRRTRAAAAGWLFFFVAIFPTLGVIGFTHTKAIASNKFAYLPSVGLLMALAGLLGWLWDSTRTRGRAIAVKAAMCAGMLAASAGAAALSRSYLASWRSTEKLFEHMMAHAPNTAWIRMDYATELKRQGRGDEAIEHYRRAIEMEDGYMVRRNLAVALSEKGDFEQAIVHCRRALALKPGYSEGHASLASALSKIGRTDEAVGHYREAIRLDPTNYGARHNFATLLLTQGKLDEAISQYERAIQLRPDRFEAYHGEAMALSRKGLTDRAIARCRQAVRLNGDFVAAHNDLARLLVVQPRGDARSCAEAIALAERACRLTDYRSPKFLDTLAAAYAAAGDFQRAVTTAGKAAGLAESLGRASLAREIRSRQARYRSGKALPRAASK